MQTNTGVNGMGKRTPFADKGHLKKKLNEKRTHTNNSIEAPHTWSWERT